MPISISINIKGAKELAAALQKYPQVSKKHMNAAFTRCGKIIEREAKSQAPFRTGELRTRIYALPGRNLAVRVISDADHSIYVHEGTIHFPANRFLSRALTRKKRDCTREIARGIQATFRDIARKAR